MQVLDWALAVGVMIGWSICCSRRVLGSLNVALVSIALAVPLGAQQSTREPISAIRQHFEAALHDQQSGSLEAATNEYQEVIRLDPQLAEAYANLGLVYYAQSKFQESANALSAAAKLKPGMEGVMLWLGVDDIKLGAPAHAVPLLRGAVRRAPSDPQAQKWLGTALWNSGHPFAALAQLEKVSRLFPSDEESWFALGEAYRKEANRQMEALLASAQGTPLLHQVYGDIYKDQRLWIRAADHYRKATQKDPHWKGAHVGLAEIDLAQGEYTDAENELRRELDIDPSSVTAKAILAETKLLTGEVPEALSLLKTAIQAAPYGTSASLGLPPLLSQSKLNPKSDPSASLRRTYADLQRLPSSSARSLALVLLDQKLDVSRLSDDFENYEKMVGSPPPPADPLQRARDDADRGRFREALPILEAEIKAHPKKLEARYLLATTLKGRSRQALHKLIAIDPDSPRVHQLLGQTYEDLNDDDKALAEYRTVEKMDPSSPGIHYQVGHLLWKFGDRTNALRELHEELKLNPFHAEANGEIGTILVIQNQPRQAIPYLRTALRINPGLLLVHQQLGEAYMMEKNYAEAAQELKLAAREDLDGSAHYQLGMAYRKLGRMREATKEIEECAKIRAERMDQKRQASTGSTIQ